MLPQIKMQISASPLLHHTKYYLSYRLKNFASGKILWKEKAINYSAFALRRFFHSVQKEMDVSERNTRKIPPFHLTVIHVTDLSCERASRTLLKTRKGYVPWLSS